MISPGGQAYLLANHFLPALTTRVLNRLSLAFPLDGRPTRHLRTRRIILRLIGGAPI